MVDLHLRTDDGHRCHSRILATYQSTPSSVLMTMFAQWLDNLLGCGCLGHEQREALLLLGLVPSIKRILQQYLNPDAFDNRELQSCSCSTAIPQIDDWSLIMMLFVEAFL